MEKATKQAAAKLKKPMAKKPVCAIKKLKEAAAEEGGLKEGSSSFCGQESKWKSPKGENWQAQEDS